MLVERGLALFFFVGSAAYLYGATGLAIGSLAMPKAGFLPTIVGALAVLISGIDLVMTLRAAPRPAGEDNFTRAAVAVVLLVTYVAALPFTGFLAATIVCTFLLLKIAGTSGYWLPALLSVVLAAIVQVGFGTLLNLQLP
jgi:NO-binding membrane sensor protein with MHYT domain